MTREQLIETLSDIRAEYNCFDPMEQQQYHALSEAIEALTERKNGKWIYLGDGYKCPWSCSKCSSCTEEQTDYCPDCGAKMKGEQDDE